MKMGSRCFGNQFISEYPQLMTPKLVTLNGGLWFEDIQKKTIIEFDFP